MAHLHGAVCYANLRVTQRRPEWFGVHAQREAAALGVVIGESGEQAIIAALRLAWPAGGAPLPWPDRRR